MAPLRSQFSTDDSVMIVTWWGEGIEKFPRKVPMKKVFKFVIHECVWMTDSWRQVQTASGDFLESLDDGTLSPSSRNIKREQLRIENILTSQSCWPVETFVMFENWFFMILLKFYWFTMLWNTLYIYNWEGWLTKKFLMEPCFTK